ncbi:hypothetical protein HDU98_003142, partial [Podochytrium sp. JEL0797]
MLDSILGTTPPGPAVMYSMECDSEPPIKGEGKARVNAWAPATDELPVTSASQIRSLHHNFLRGVEIAGDHPFLGTRPITNGIAGPYIWQTYAETFQRVKNFGSGLHEFVSSIPVRFGIFSINRAEWIIVEQACFMYGIVTVPLYDMFANDALKHILHETEIEAAAATRDKAKDLLRLVKQGGINFMRLVVVMDGMDAELVALAAETGVGVVSMPEVEKKGAREYVPPLKESTRADVGTICYTSGTTGTPKGVILTHGNMLALMDGVAVLHQLGRFNGLTSDDVYISYLPLAHVFERTMIACLIHVGASIGFYQGDILKLMYDVSELSPTIFASVPRVFNRLYDKSKKYQKSSTLYQKLAQAGYIAKEEGLKNGHVKHSFWDFLVFSGMRERLGGRVRLILTGAAPIGKHVLDFFRIMFSVDVVEGYGLTETCSVLTLTDRFDCSGDQVGYPMPGCQVKLISIPEMNYSMDSPFSRGEICVRGPSVFQGYFKRPEETLEVLDEKGWFKTGDVGQWDAQGRLKIVDRKKSLFKLAQGEYVAPERIENI